MVIKQHELLHYDLQYNRANVKVTLCFNMTLTMMLHKFKYSIPLAILNYHMIKRDKFD